VCPLGFLYGIQNNYLVASYVNQTSRPRHYILDQIQSAALTSKTFDANGFDLRKYAEKSFGSWIAHSGGYKVKWKVRPEAAERASRFVFHPTQKITPQKDGGLIVEFVADGLREMAWHLMTWEGNIKPIAPKELVDEYKNQLKLAAEALKF
jgi:predicted DNA-binding transcriptional regulator YafY